MRLAIPRLKAEVVRWRGAARYGGATLTAVGTVEEVLPSGELRLRAEETGQRFRLRAGAKPGGPSTLTPGERLRVVGKVIKGGERNDDEIVLELQRAEPAAGAVAVK